MSGQGQQLCQEETPVTETRYTKPCEALAICTTLSRGVVGVVSSMSSKPALEASSLISPVSSRGMSGTSKPGYNMPQGDNLSVCLSVRLRDLSSCCLMYVCCMQSKASGRVDAQPISPLHAALRQALSVRYVMYSWQGCQSCYVQ